MIGPLARLITALVRSPFATEKLVMVLAKPNKEDLTVMHDLMKAKKVTPVIDKRHS